MREFDITPAGVSQKHSIDLFAETPEGSVIIAEEITPADTALMDPRRIGERVLVDPVVRSAGAQEVGYVGSEYNGAFAAYAVVPASNAWQISSGLTDVELASFPCSYATAENMLSRARVRADESVLVTGASGGVGSAAIQLARRRGAHVIAIGGALKSTALRALGATSVLARDSDLTAMPGRASVDVVIDVVGGAHFGQFRRGIK